MPRRRRTKVESEDQFILIKAEAAYPRRWQGIRSTRTYAAQVKGTMFEPKPEDRQMDLFGMTPPNQISEGKSER